MNARAERLWTGIGLGVALGFAVAIAVGAMADDPESSTPVTPAGQQVSGPTVHPTTADELRNSPIVQAVELVKPAVVSITTETVSADLFQFARRGAAKSSDGSGVIIDTRGIVLTNAHVVSRASRITITLADGRSAEASVLGIAPSLDLAVLSIEGVEDLEAVEPATNTDLLLGESVIAIGNPFGLGHTVTTGVVSATRRPLATDEQVYQDFIQTDASINPGNSGGPLLNIHGQLIGITTSVHEEAQGIGFAIPADRAVKVARDLMETGEVQIAWLGITLEDVTMRRTRNRQQAVRIRRVIKDGPGEKAGLKQGDILLAIADRSIVSRADLNTYLSGEAPGASIQLAVTDAEGERVHTVSSANVVPEIARVSLEQVMGCRIRSRLVGERTEVQVEKLDPRGNMSRRGLRTGDIIRAVDGRRVHTPEELQMAIQRALSRHRPSALLDIQRGRARGRVPVEI